jgi:hypothetical protein
MKFNNNVIGPDFDKADIVSFDFGEAEVSLVLPKDPDSDLGYIAPQNQQQLSTAPNFHCRTHPFGFRIIDLVKKSWNYCDEYSEIPLAFENFNLNLIEITDEIRAEMSPLNKQEFIDWLFAFFKRIAVRGDSSLLGSDYELVRMKAYKMPLSKAEIELYPAGRLNWPMLTIDPPDDDADEANTYRDPDYFIYIPLSEKLFLYIDNSVSISSRATDSGAFSTPDILQLKRDILMEILAHIKVTYSPDILQLIEEQNSET